MTTEHARVVVVGGGVIGCAVLREFARRRIPGILLEAEPDVGEGASKANSAILHTGFDSKPGTIESTMLRRAASLWPTTLEELSVPFLPLGALMLAHTAEEAHRLTTEIAANATVLGVSTELLDRAAVRDVAPYLADDVTAALSIPGEGVLDPFWLTRAYADAAIAGGAEVRLGQAVIGLGLSADAVTLRLADGSTIEAEQVVNAAGLRADVVAGLVGDRSFGITPRKGQFLVSEEAFGVDRIVLPIPGPHGKGMLVTPIIFGGLLLGPTAVDATDKDDRSTDPVEGLRILAACQAMVPALVDALPVRQFVGLRPVSSTRDFILRPSTISDRLYLAAGIRSTGISTSPAVAEAVVDEVLARRGWPAVAPPRTLLPPSIDLSEAPGEIVCLCRSISRGEIEAACRQPTEPRTLDAIKRRSGAMFGDCQGNLCSLDVARIVAAERAIPVSAVEKHRRGSWLWEAAADPRPADAPRRAVRDARQHRHRGHRPRGRGSGGGPGGDRSGRVRRRGRQACRRHRGRPVPERSRRLGRAGPVHGGQRRDRDDRRDRRDRRLCRAARASSDRGWPAGRRDDRRPGLAAPSSWPATWACRRPRRRCGRRRRSGGRHGRRRRPGHPPGRRARRAAWRGPARSGPCRGPLARG